MTIAAETPCQPDVERLLGLADQRSAALYPAESRHGATTAALLDQGVVFFVVRAAGRAVGCGGFVAAGHEAELKRIFVEEPARGTGLGRLILDTLEAAALARGVAVMRLETGVQSAEALGLYRRAGYVARGPFGRYGPDPLSVFMEKRLGSSGGPMSREAFYAWVEQQPRGRYERIDGHVVAMAPEKGAHLRAKAAVFLALRAALDGAGIDCQVLPDGATVPTGDSDYEPDAVVNCGPPMGDDAVAAPYPVIVVEVLSPSTRGVDTGAKLAGYLRVPSIVHYLIVHPTRRQVIHHRRQDDGTVLTAIVAGGPLLLDPPGLVVAVDAFYPPG